MTADLSELEARVERLEAQMARLLGGQAGPGSGDGDELAPRRRLHAAAAVADSGADAAWTAPYRAASLDIDGLYIEMHEPSARRQLHRLILEVVEVEGPVTEGLALRRVREAWGVKRAGARIQTVFEQAVRQLAFNGKLERAADGELRAPGQELEAVRVPAAGDDASRRAADEVPSSELQLALLRTVQATGRMAADDATQRVARLFGWTRRGPEIQTRLDRALERLTKDGRVVSDGANLTAAPGS